MCMLKSFGVGVGLCVGESEAAQPRGFMCIVYACAPNLLAC